MPKLIRITLAWTGTARHLLRRRRFGESLLSIWRASRGRDAGVSKAAGVVFHIR
jgi:hypothetical protein